MSTVATDEPHLSSNNASNIDDNCDDNNLVQTTDEMNSPSTASPTATTSQIIMPIIKSTARRQSLRSYLKNVSLSDAILLHPPDNQNNNNTARSPPEKKAGKNRRRRLEVMGLLQHLKIHRYEDDSFAVDKRNTNSNVDLDGETKGEDNNVVSSDGRLNDNNNVNTTSGSTKTTPNNNKSTIPNPPTQIQRCLLHPTVRLRNDKCSLCCALTKTLEVRRVKLLESGLDNDGGGSCCNGGLLVNDDDNYEGNVLDATASLSAASSSVNGFVEEADANSATIVKSSTGNVKESAAQNEDELHGEIENHPLELGEDEQLQLINVGISKLQQTIALAKGALDSKSRPQQQQQQQQNGEGSSNQQRRSSSSLKEEGVSSPDKRRGSDDAVSVVSRCSSSGGSHESDTTQPLPLLREVVVPAATTTTTTTATFSSDVSVKSTSDLSTLTSSTMGNNSLGSHSLGRKLGTTSCLPSKAIEEDDDDDDGDEDDASKANEASRTVTITTCDTKSEEEDGDGAVSVSTHDDVVMRGKLSCSVSGSDDDPKKKTSIQSANVVVEDVYSDEENEDGHVPSTETVQLQSQPTVLETSTSNEEEGNDEEMIDSEKTGTTSVATPKRKDLGKEVIADEQSPSPNSVAEGPSTTTSLSLEEAATTINDAADGGTVDPTLASQAESNKAHQDSFHTNSPSTSGENSPNKNPNQFSEVERRLSRVNNRLSRSTNRRDNNDKRSSRSRSRSIESKIPFFAALVEHARSRSNSRTRRRSRSRSVTREGGENTGKGEKKLESLPRSKSRSVQRSGRDEDDSNKQEKSGSRTSSRSRSVTAKDGGNSNKKSSRGRSRSTARNTAEHINVKEKSESDKRGKVVSANAGSPSSRRRSESRSVTREGAESGEKKLESRQRSKSRSVRRSGRDNSSSNKHEKSGLRSSSRSRSVTAKDGGNGNKKSARGRSRSTARNAGENISVNEKTRCGIKEKKKSELAKRGKVVSAKEEEEYYSNGMASEHKPMNDKKALSSEEVSPSLPDHIPPDPFKVPHLPNVRSMTVKALKAELNLFKVDHSTFNEKEQFIAAVRQSRETSPRPQSEVTSMKLKELKGELAIYNINYSSFREKSEFVEALKNAWEAELESVPQQTVVPPEEDITEEPILTIVHREPITHPRYKLGDAARDEDMIIFPKSSRSGRGRRRRGQDSSEASSADADEEQDSSNQCKVTASVKELQHLDAAFIRRSDGRWTYAIVADGDGNGIRFVLDKKGATKILTKEMWKKNVRRIKVLTQRKGDVLKVNGKSQKKRRDTRRSISKKKSRLVSPSPTRNYRYRKLDVLSVPPTITEDKVFMGKGRTPKPEPMLKRRRQYSQAGAGVTDALPEWAHVLNESGLIF